MMGKRRSIGSDPLDWIGEPGSLPRSEPSREAGEGAVLASSPDPANPGAAVPSVASGPPGSMVPLEGASTSYTLERQLLLVDGVLREGVSKPRLNQVLWILLFLLTLLGTGFLLFQETRRQWGQRIVTLEGAIERIEKERGRNERILEQVITEKDNLIREKQGTISKIEGLHQTLTEELGVARGESRDLKSQNRELIDRLLKPQVPQEGRAAPAPPPKPADQVLEGSEK